MFEKVGAGVVAVFTIALIAVPISLWCGFVLMIAVGAVHGWIHAVPTMGFWTAVVIAYGVAALSASMRPSK